MTLPGRVRALTALLALALPVSGCSSLFESKPPCDHHHYKKLHQEQQPLHYGKC